MIDKENCRNCGKETCALAGVGNEAGVNENNGCWIPQGQLNQIQETKNVSK